ncbi:unnamed protein product [Bemisia tabaci]|uniref:Oligomycin sensitivity conferral protein n=1 Tax=Bemisia tabaci TaxID=7038 RepID=A0A9P0A8A5_BEMTA|nr:PREDICTED: ATP synthase subunit O, mitochondrial [Bemisia tabaci]CAH0385227.1 unnamed protein product [Bemisia tabaci]
MAANQTQVFIRALSSSAACRQLVKPPISVFGLEGRYATALYSAATKQKQLDAVNQDLLKFEKLLKESTSLKDFFGNPSVKKHALQKAVVGMAADLKFQPSTANLLDLLAENGRLNKLHGIINNFKQIMAAHRGDLPVEVTTAKPLDDASKQELMAALKQFAKKGENIIIETKVDPAIIGGMVVVIGDRYVDMSIASKIKKYSELISSAA